MTEKNKKLLIIDSSVENCDTTISICEGDLFETLQADVEQYGMARSESAEDVINKMKADGSYIDPDDEADDPCLIYRKGESPFGTDMVTLKYWAPDDILERFNISYIVIPGEEPKSERALMREAVEATMRFLDNDPGEDDVDDAVKVQTIGRIYSAAKEFVNSVEEAGYSY